MHTTNDPEVIRAAVRQRYSEIATEAEATRPNTGCCSSPAPKSTVACCGADAQARTLGYTDADLSAVPEGSNLGLGCGNPVAA